MYNLHSITPLQPLSIYNEWQNGTGLFLDSCTCGRARKSDIDAQIAHGEVADPDKKSREAAGRSSKMSPKSGALGQRRAKTIRQTGSTSIMRVGGWWAVKQVRFGGTASQADPFQQASFL